MYKLKNVFKVLISCYLLLLQVSGALSRSQKRIVGGIPTTINNARFVAQLLSDGSIICGGTVVSSLHVITAAHCFDNKPRRLSVVVGATRLTDTGLRSKVSKIMIPTSYNNDTYHMDVAAIKLRKPLEGALVQPIALCKHSWKNGDPVKLFGWGKRVEDADNLPIQLHTVNVEVVDTDLCGYKLRDEQPLTDSMFCAAAPGRDACSGDSGGPGILDNEFCGIISWGVGCANKKIPGVLTNVNKALRFITDAMEK